MNDDSDSHVSGPSDTESPVHKIHYVWKIDHYSYYDAKGKVLDSPVFTAATTIKYKWHLSISPNYGSKSGEKDSVSLYLYMDCTTGRGKVFAKFRFAILDDYQKEIHSRRSSKVREFIVVDRAARWGYTPFIKKDLLFNGKFLPNDKLTIYCAVIFSETEFNTGTFTQFRSSQLETGVSDDNLSKHLGLLYTNQDFCDVVLSVNHKEYRAHKSILAARSPVFHAMFTHDTKENENNRVEIKDIDEKVIEQMLYYIYTGKCDNLEKLAEGLFVAADKYDLPALKFKCEEVLCKDLSIENATRTLILAELHRSNKLKSNTISFIIANSEKIVNTTTWDSLVSTHSQLFNEVFKSLSRQFTALSPN